MRSETEINKELEKLLTSAPMPTGDSEDNHKFTAHAIAGQAIAWVLGEHLTPSEMIENEFKEN